MSGQTYKIRSQLLRQNTCPALVSGKPTIPFIIPSYSRPSPQSSLIEEPGGTNILKKRVSELENFHQSALSLGSVNRDLYIIDQYDGPQQQSGGPEGHFSSLSEANFPPDHVGRVWFALNYEEKSEKLMLSLLKARNLRRIAPDKEPKVEHSEVCPFPDVPIYDDTKKLKQKRKLFSLKKREVSESKKDFSIADTIKSMGDFSRSIGTMMAADIAQKPGLTQEINSMVKIYLLPDERMLGQAKCKRRDVDPIFVDRFVFQVSSSELPTRSLRMVFVEIDDSRRHHVIGHVTYSLLNEALNGEIVFEDIKRGDPQSCQDKTESMGGEIQLSLCYNSDLSRLTIVLLRIRMSLPQSREKEFGEGQTSNIEVNAEFSLDESFRFPLEPGDLDRASLTIDVRCTHNGSETHRNTALGSFMFARGKAVEQWSEMQNNPKEFIKAWQHLVIQ